MMTLKFKNGQRVQITGTYSGKPTGVIVKYSKNLDAYNVKGDDGYNYNCVSPDELVLLEEKNSENKVKSTVEKFRKPIVEDEEVEEKHAPAFFNRIEELEEAAQSGEEITLSNAQAMQLLAEIQYIREDKEGAYATLSKIQWSLDELRKRPRI